MASGSFVNNLDKTSRSFDLMFVHQKGACISRPNSMVTSIQLMMIFRRRIRTTTRKREGFCLG